MTEHKKYAQLARDFYAGKIDFEKFMYSTPEDIEDPVVDKLVDLVVNEPVVGENGTTQAKYDKYMEQVEAHLRKMEASEK
jgi:hypothetical protein